MFKSQSEVMAYATLLGASTPWNTEHGNKYCNADLNNFWIDLLTVRSHTDVHELMFQLTEMGYHVYLVTDPDLINVSPTTVFVSKAEITSYKSVYLPYLPKKD